MASQLRIWAAAVAWLILAAIVFVTLAPLELRPQTGHALLERAAAYFSLGTAFALGYPRRLYFAIGVVVCAAIGLEAAQLLAPTRHGHIVDAAEKLVGGAAGLAIGRLTLAALGGPNVSTLQNKASQG